MAGGTDLIGAFRAYAQKALGNDFNPEKAAAALNSWVKESSDALKERIERETERAVKKLGLAKESDLRRVSEELAQLRKELGLKTRKSPTSTRKKRAVQKSAKKSVNVAKNVQSKTKKKQQRRATTRKSAR